MYNAVAVELLKLSNSQKLELYNFFLLKSLYKLISFHKQISFEELDS